MISVGRPYFPNKKKLFSLLERVYDNAWLTNNGPLCKEFRDRLQSFLGVENLLLCANGTLALQVAYKALGISGKAITTPFSFIATASSLDWEKVPFKFSDIDKATFNLSSSILGMDTDFEGIDSIVPVHVFGNPCDVETFEKISKKHSLKVVYDAAHSFNVKYKNNSILSYGDASTLSFHATKLFHSTEGGAVVFKNKADLERAERLINFGFDSKKNLVEMGINAKMSEMHAAMGICVLDEFHIISERVEEIANVYKKELSGFFEFQKWSNNSLSNNSYFPILCKSEIELNHLVKKLNMLNIFPRRYFYPSLDTLEFSGEKQYSMQNSIDIASRVLCLPIYPELCTEDIQSVVNALKS